MIDKTVPVRATLDHSADATYIYLVDRIAPGGVARTVCVDPREVGGMINLDLDSDGRVVGIELLSASALLPRTFLARLNND
jgi:uncharacterized protein YuzE